MTSSRLGSLFSAALLLTALCACSASTGPDPLRVGATEVIFATVPQAAELLGTPDSYTRHMGDFDRALRVGREGVTPTQYLAHARAQARAWPPEEQAQWTQALQTVGRAMNGLELPLPPRVIMVRTSGREEFGAAYTRSNAIFLPPSQARRTAERALGLASHELFHVASRYASNDWRDAVYALLGFQRRTAAPFPPALANRRLTNPDAFTLEHAVQVRTKANELRWVIPILVSRRALAAAIAVNDLMAIMGLRLLDAETGHVLPLSQTDFAKRVAKNTEYIIHPEEAMADQFALLITRRAGRLKSALPAPELPDALEKLLSAAQ